MGQQRAAEDITKWLILSIHPLYHAGIPYVIAVTHAITLALVIIIYHIAGKFGREKVWWIDSFWVFGESKFGELIDQLIGY